MKTRIFGITLLLLTMLLLSFSMAHADTERGCEYRYTDELKIPENSRVTSVTNYVYHGSIYYTTPRGLNGVLVMGPLSVHPWPYQQLRMAVIVNERTRVSLTYLQGKLVKELKAIRKDMYCPVGPGFSYVPYASQWIVWAKL
jgi:hypothetical protein